MVENDLIRNARIIMSSADMVYYKKDYTSATILYFKAAFLILDYILLQSKGQTPKDHTERFRMLELSDKNLYVFLDKNFKIYRQTYTTTTDKFTCDKVRENVRKIIKEYKINI